MQLNNSPQPTDPPAGRRDEQRPETTQRGGPLESGTNNSIRSGRANELGKPPPSSSSQPEDWHLLEAELRDPKLSDSALASPPSSGHEINSENRRPAYIDTKHPERDGYSPVFVFLSAALYSLLPMASAAASLTLLVMLFTRFYYIPLLYLAYILLDRNTCNRGEFVRVGFGGMLRPPESRKLIFPRSRRLTSGGCRMELVYNSKFWSHLAAYFPIRLRHTANFALNPDENYILNYHPHGISAFGAVTAFATNGLGFRERFRGMVARFMVHETSFLMPVLKETFLLRGDCSVSSRSIDHLLAARARGGQAGHLLCIVGGGLAEADLSEAELLKVVVAKRKGFVKKALIHGAHLVPCIAFGENSVFKKVHLRRGSLWHRLETKWYQIFKFKHPIYYGRSMLSEKLAGALPYRRPITVVMGDPIHVRRCEEPSQADIDQLHARYIRQLTAMYAANGDLCSKYDRELRLV